MPCESPYFIYSPFQRVNSLIVGVVMYRTRPNFRYIPLQKKHSCTMLSSEINSSTYLV